MVKPRARAAALITGLALLLGTTALTPAYAQGPVPATPPPGTPPEGVPTTVDPLPSLEGPGNRDEGEGEPAVTLDTAPQAGSEPTAQPGAAPSPGVAGAPAASPSDPTAQGAAPGSVPPPLLVEQTGPVVSRILVRGNERIEAGTVLSYLPIQPGQAASPERLDLALDALSRTGLFADLAIEIEGQDLIVRVVENPIVNQVVFEGNNSITEEKLRDEVIVRPRGIFTRARVQQDVQRILDLYRNSGRIAATVSPQIVQLPQKRVDLVFEITEGPKTGIARVNFLGNEEFSDRDLRGVVATEESRFYRFFSSNDTYDPDRLEYDREQLRKHYTNRGFYDFRVVSSIAELEPDQSDFRVTFTVDEGEEYDFGELRVDTQLQRLDAEVLRALLPIQKGDTYQSDRIEQAVDALTFAAGAAGFAFVEIRPRETPNRATNTVDVNFEVREGPRVYVERIDVVGNARTLDRVIRRELRLAEGDAFNRLLVDRSQNDVQRLGYFEDVTIEELPGSAPDRTVLQVGVEEQATGELSFSAGFSSVEQFLFDFGLSERNFRGRGQALRARLSLGSRQQLVDFSFTEPRFRGRDLSAGVDLFTQRVDQTDQSFFSSSRTGGTFRLGFPTSVNSFLFTRYELRQDELFVEDDLCATGDLGRFCDQEGSSLTSLAGYTYRLDRRNQPRRPTRGFDLTFRQDLAGLGGDVNFLRSELEGEWHYGFRPQWILSALGSTGYIQGYNDDRVRLFDRFFKGGNSFRGFERFGLGPRDLERDDALGGKAYGIGALELSFPTPLPEQYGIGTALFVEAGTLGRLDDRDKLIEDENGQLVDNPFIRDDLSLRASAGLSVFWDSPLGPIRLDFSQVLSKEDYDRTETFRFSQSARF